MIIVKIRDVLWCLLLIMASHICNKMTSISAINCNSGKKICKKSTCYLLFARRAIRSNWKTLSMLLMMFIFFIKIFIIFDFLCSLGQWSISTGKPCPCCWWRDADGAKIGELKSFLFIFLTYLNIINTFKS